MTANDGDSCNITLVLLVCTDLKFVVCFTMLIKAFA